MSFNASLSLRLLVSAVDAMGGSFNVGGAPIELATTEGTGVNEGDDGYSGRHTVTNAATPVTLDLAGGSLIGIKRTAVTFAEVIAIFFRNNSTTATFAVGGGSNAPAWLPARPVLPGEVTVFFVRADPAHVVTAGTGDIVRVESDDATNPHTFDIVILGRSA